MSELALNIDGVEKTVPAGTTAADYYSQRREVVVARIDGELVDLATPLASDTTVEAVTIDSPAGLEVLRHSAAHVLAQAVQEAFGEARLGIGPPIEDGFYYDFDVEEPFTPEDLKALDKAMSRIIKSGQTFRRRVVTEEEARIELADEPYKLELIGLKGTRGEDAEEAAEGAGAEIGAGDLTIYDNVNRKGEVVWKDLCRGPHLPSTRLIANGYALMRSAAAYWRGLEANPQLQRIYGTAWPTKDELRAYQERIAEAERRDHRRLGAQLDLFSFPEEIGSGLPVFHPKGGIIRLEMEEYSRKRHLEAGYQFVNTPHITKSELFETSGHLDWYAEAMYPPMHLNEAKDKDQDGEQGEGVDVDARTAGQDYYLKPMNCPLHILIYQSRGRSYRELPLRMFEFGTVYRYEKSGVVHGLTRARGFTQDDAHIFATREQMKAEIAHALQFVLDLLRDYGLDDFYLEISSKDPEKFVGTEEMWEESTETLRQVCIESGLELVEDPGGAAFYGPKVSVQTRDAIGRTWQMSTVQLDLNLPELFDLEYQASDGTRQRPVMIHRALFGSIERFFGVLTEHYAGAFPPWLAPVQVEAIPVAEPFEPYLQEIVNRLQARGVRAELNDADDRFPKKIRTASKQKIPFVLIAGGEDQEAGAVSFRFRDGSQDNGVPVDDAIERIVEAIETRAQV